MARTIPAPLLVLAGLAPVVAAPIITFALIGDQSSTTDPNPDYFWHPPSIAASTVTTWSLIFTVLAMIGLGMLIPRWKDGTVHTAWKRVVICLVMCGILTGAFYRVATAAVIGVNLGAALMALFGGPAFLALLVGAIFAAFRTRTPPPTATPAER